MEGILTSLGLGHLWDTFLENKGDGMARRDDNATDDGTTQWHDETHRTVLISIEETGDGTTQWHSGTMRRHDAKAQQWHNAKARRGGIIM